MLFRFKIALLLFTIVFYVPETHEFYYILGVVHIQWLGRILGGSGVRGCGGHILRGFRPRLERGAGPT